MNRESAPIIGLLNHVKGKSRKQSDLLTVTVASSLLVSMTDNIDEALGLLARTREHIIEIDRKLNK